MKKVVRLLLILISIGTGVFFLWISGKLGGKLQAEEDADIVVIGGGDDRVFYVPENTTYIGYSYNALSGDQFDGSNLKNMQEVFDWETVYYSGQLRMDRNQKAISETYCESSREAYMEALSEKDSAKLAVKFGKWKLYDKTWSEDTRREYEQESNVTYFQDYRCLVTRSYFLDQGEDPYYFYLKRMVKMDLMEPSISPEAFIKKYGTHVAVGTSVGMSIETDSISAAPGQASFAVNQVGRPEINPAGIIEGVYEDRDYSYDNFEAQYDFYDSRFQGLNTSIPFPCTVRLIADGDYVSGTDNQRLPVTYEHASEDRVLLEHLIFRGITEIDGKDSGVGTFYHVGKLNSDKFLFGYRPDDDEYHPMDEGDYDTGFTYRGDDQALEDWNKQDWSSLVGPRNDDSLVPFWELIPTDTPEGQARKQEFLDYINGL